MLADSFIAGKLDVIVDYDPQAMRAAELGDGRVFATSASYAGIIPEGFAALRSKWQVVPVERRVKFWTGCLKAVVWLGEPGNWGEYQRILNERTYPFDDDFSEAQLKGMVEAVRIHNWAKLKERNTRAGGVERYLDELHAFLARNGMLQRPFTPAEILDTESFMQAIEAFAH